MGWVNYLINRKKKIAYQISRHSTDIEKDFIKDFEELYNYIYNTDEGKLRTAIIDYLKSKAEPYMPSYQEFENSLIALKLGLDETIHEDELPKDFLILN